MHDEKTLIFIGHVNITSLVNQNVFTLTYQLSEWCRSQPLFGIRWNVITNLFWQVRIAYVEFIPFPGVDFKGKFGMFGRVGDL